MTSAADLPNAEAGRAADAEAAASRVVAVVAPGGYDADGERLTRASRYFAARGAHVSHCLDPSARHQRFSDSDSARLAWLQAVVDDPSVDIAIALRGGYGATRLLPRIDFAAMAAAVGTHGTRFIGHSDFTAISLGLLAVAGAVSFAGPMAGYDFGGAGVDPFTEEHFWRAMDESRVELAFPTDHDGAIDVAGTLWGGNLAMIASLVGTPWLPVVDGGVLFVEDVNEQPYRIERMLLQLHHAGVLKRQKLILCGDITGYRETSYDNGYDLAAALDYVRRHVSTPIVTGLPFGHGPRKATLAIGAAATVSVRDGTVRVRQHWDLHATRVAARPVAE